MQVACDLIDPDAFRDGDIDRSAGRVGGDPQDAAEVLGMSLSSFYRWRRRHEADGGERLTGAKVLAASIEPMLRRRISFTRRSCPNFGQLG
jgi:hypothetical protein